MILRWWYGPRPSYLTWSFNRSLFETNQSKKGQCGNDTADEILKTISNLIHKYIYVFLHTCFHLYIYILINT